MRYLVILIIAMLTISCEKDVFEGHELEYNNYESDYPDKRIVILDEAEKRATIGSCALILKFHLDLEGVYIHPSKIGNILIFENGENIDIVKHDVTEYILPNKCYKEGRYMLILRDADGVVVGQRTRFTYRP